mgnify:CR=1 FL=1
MPTYSIEGFSPTDINLINSTLQDKRGWVSKGHTFHQISSYTSVPVDITIELQDNNQIVNEYPQFDNMSYANIRSTPATIVINKQLWDSVPDEYPPDTSLTSYRQFLISHEMGHHITNSTSHEFPYPNSDHKWCPVMHQQYKGGCVGPNPWITLDHLPAPL